MIQSRRLHNISALPRLAVFMVGILLLIGTWVVWYEWISLDTEALLVPWYCCRGDPLCCDSNFPALGTWSRVLNDFFYDFPGNTLPSLAFIFINVSLFGLKVLRAKNKTWLPLVFFLANTLLLVVDQLVTVLSWSLSDWLVGPRVGGIDAGYHRTWYGIASHLILWGLFFVALAKARVTSS
jgi:hypothetical protein